MAHDPLRLAIIDEEHRGIHRELANLLNAITLGVGSEEVLLIVNGAFRATRLHFKHEESVLKKIGFLRLEQHKREHSKIARMLNKIVLLLGKRDSAAAFALIREYRKTLLLHLQNSDEQYREAVDSYADSMGLPRLPPRIRLAIENE